MVLDRYGSSLKNHPEHLYHTGRLFMPTSVLFATSQDHPHGHLIIGGRSHSTSFSGEIRAHADKAWCLAASPKNTIIATGSSDKSIKLWTLRGDLIVILTEHTEKVQCLAFSPDGLTLASGSADETIRLWDMRTLECTHVLRGHKGRVSSLAFTVDGHIVSGSWDKTVKTWRADSEEATETLSVQKEVFSVAVSPDDSLIAIGAAKMLALYDRRTRSKPRSLGHVSSSVFSVAFAPSGDRVVAGMKDGSVRSWDQLLEDTRAYSGEQSSFRHSKEVTSVAWSSDGTKVFSASRDTTVHIHDVLESGTFVNPHNGRAFTSPLQDLLVLPHASHSRLVVVDEDGGMAIWDEEFLDVSFASSEAADIATLVFSPDGTLLATASFTGTVIVRNTANGRMMGSFGGSGAFPQDIFFSDDGAELSLIYEDGSESTWKAGTDFLLTSTVSSPDTHTEDELVFTTDDYGCIYASNVRIIGRLRVCWIPLDRRWSGQEPRLRSVTTMVFSR
jgi:WD40 repeat protein